MSVGHVTIRNVLQVRIGGRLCLRHTIAVVLFPRPSVEGTDTVGSSSDSLWRVSDDAFGILAERRQPADELFAVLPIVEALFLVEEMLRFLRHGPEPEVFQTSPVSELGCSLVVGHGFDPQNHQTERSCDGVDFVGMAGVS